MQQAREASRGAGRSRSDIVWSRARKQQQVQRAARRRTDRVCGSANRYVARRAVEKSFSEPTIWTLFRVCLAL